jgi:hypothetical protein
MIPIAAPGPNYCLCIIPLLLLLLIPLLYFLLSSKTTPAVVVGPAGPTGTCTIYGDPHILTFDKKHNDFYSQGEYWVVKSDTVSIQARYLPTPMTHGLSVTKEVIIGGPFLKGHKLKITARAAFWDGKPILTGFPSHFENVDPPVLADYNSQGSTLQKGREGKALHIVHVTLPLGVLLQINRWTEASEGDYINILLTMPKQPNQDGHCGNFNGNAADDDRMQIRARVGKTGVAPADLLFNRKTPVVVANRPDINDCPADTLKTAEAQCKAKEKSFFPSQECLIDVCFGGPGFAKEDAM